MMALTADVGIEILDLATKRARITGTVDDPTSGDTLSVVILDTTLDTAHPAAERARLKAELFTLYNAEKTKREQVDSLLATWEAVLSADLTAMVNA